PYIIFGMAFDNQGNLLVSQYNPDGVGGPDGLVKFAPNGTILSTTAVSTTAGYADYLEAITFDRQGNLYGVGSQSGDIQKISPSGATTTIGNIRSFGAPEFGAFLAVDGSGNVLATAYDGRAFNVARISPESEMTRLGTGGGFMAYDS